MHMNKGLAAVSLIGTLLTTTVQLRGDETVDWNYFDGFTPVSVVISPGETVTWRNMDDFFDVTINVAGASSFTLDQFEEQNVVFPFTGTFGVTSDQNDHGSVIVNLPPSVTITNPLNDATFFAPASFSVQVSSSDADGITQVEFYLDSILGTEYLGVDYEAPYSVTVANLPPGDYTLTAYAYDPYRRSSDSIAITVVENSAAIQLGNPRLAGGKFLFDVNGLTGGKTNVLQSSTNFVAWTSIVTNVAAGASATFTNSYSASACFYRVMELP
jgi:hypothetical protein